MFHFKQECAIWLLVPNSKMQLLKGSIGLFPEDNFYCRMDIWKFVAFSNSF